MAHRLTGAWHPTAESFHALVSKESDLLLPSQPYPFCLANPVNDTVDSIGPASDYLAEWKWDGIRSQLIKRNEQLFLWTRGEERVEDRYPEVCDIAKSLPNGTVLDGEILAWRDDRPLSFAELQKRLGRKSVTAKLIRDIPVVFMAYDLLEYRGRDVRNEPLQQRREWLEEVVNQSNLRISERVNPNNQSDAPSWQSLAAIRETSRSRGAEGLMLKRLDSAYEVGRVRGAWWKWKIEPLTIDAVLVYAQKGHGRRSSLFTDYTFALWDGDALVPFAKAYSGLTDAEIKEVDAIIKANIKEKFGPVRGVEPVLVMELAFENIQFPVVTKVDSQLGFPEFFVGEKINLLGMRIASVIYDYWSTLTECRLHHEAKATHSSR